MNVTIAVGDKISQCTCRTASNERNIVKMVSSVTMGSQVKRQDSQQKLNQ